MFQNNLLMAAASISDAAYTIDFGCRFDTGATANLSISNGTSTSNTIATIAFWFKIGEIANKQTMFGVEGLTEGLVFDGSDKLYIVHGAGDVAFTTTQVFRDPTAWYHCVVIYDTTEDTDTNRVKLYINGAQVTAYTATTWPTEDEVFGGWNKSGSSNVVGRGDSGDPCYDGYLSEFHSIDGVAYGPTTFGEFNDYGVWRPIEVTGVTYGNNGFYLDFADSSNLGNDVSGNDNDLTSSGLAADDQFPDTPTKNWCTFSSIATRASSLANGNLKVVTAPNGSAATTMSVTSGKWYVEFTMVDGTSNERACYISQNNSKFMAANIHGDATGIVGTFVGYWSYNGNIIDFDSDYPGRAYGDTYADGDVISFALDLDNNAVWFAKNGTWQDGATEAEIEAADTSNAAQASLPAGRWFFVYSGGDYKDCIGNFGQSSYAHSVPDGFLNVNTTNLATPTILDGTENFQTTLYQGTGAVRTVGQQSNSYSNTYGSGDRSNIIVGSGTGGSTSPARGQNMIDGSTAAGPGIGSYATDMSFDFEFSQAVNITEVNIAMQGSYTGYDLGDSWLWEGSNNDSDCTTLSGTIDISSNDNPEVHSLSLIGASDTYIYYRLRNTNGDGVSSLSWDEFTFKVAPINADSTFQPDMVWIKNRSQADSNMLFDAPRGVTKVIESDTNDITTTDANSLTAFATSGFTLGTGAGGYNDNLESFVAWQWLAGGGAGSANAVGSITTTTTTVNTTAGISISTYVGTGSTATVGHGLGAVPAFMAVRNIDANENWRVYHQSNTSAPETEYLSWENTGATADLATTWNDTAPTSTVFTVGSSAATNESTKTMVAYIFAEIEGFSRFGTYMGATAGGLAYTGFKPAYVMIKKTSGTGSWVIYDSQRSPYNEVDDQLLANTTAAETTGSEEIDFLANGFKCRTTDSDINSNLGLYVFAAFAEYPFGGDGVTPATAF